MRFTTYRGVEFVDREQEEAYLLKLLSEEQPRAILFLYGPKSSGKTTLLEYIVENKLSKNPNLYVNYINFRGYAISNYSSFLKVYFYPIREENQKGFGRILTKIKLALSGVKGYITIPKTGVEFGVSLDLFKAMENNEVDVFQVFFEALKGIAKKKKPVLIIDEVQELSDIYINADTKKKYLLTEFFKFLVRLTKETHLAHIIVSTSSSLFVDFVYNHSNLTKTSEFYLVDHFDYETTRKWLEKEGFKEKEIELIWEYLGGCPFDISMLLQARNLPGFDLKSYLIRQAEIASGQIGMTISREFETEEEQNYFERLLKEILENGFAIKKDKDRLQDRVLEKGIEKNILFINPDKKKIIFNSQVMKKGAELYLSW